MVIKNIEISSIVPNPNNPFSMNDIDSLALSIEMNGLDQPLVVRKNNNKFVIMTGHRRYEAIKLLKKEGRYKSSTIPCIIKDFNDLPISDEVREILSILSTNIVRKKIFSDYAAEIKQWTIVLNALSKNDLQTLPIDIDHKKLLNCVNINQTLSVFIGLKSTQIQKIKKIVRFATPKMIKALDDGLVSINWADEHVTLNNQDEVLDKYLNGNYKVNVSERFNTDVHAIRKAIKNNKKVLTKKEKEEYDKAIKMLHNIFKD